MVSDSKFYYSYDTGLAEALDGLRQEVLLRVLLFHNYKKHDF